jgi:septum formation topological specificity factor MinE
VKEMKKKRKKTKEDDVLEKEIMRVISIYVQIASLGDRLNE